MLGADEERRVARAAAAGNRRARDRLIEANLRLVVSIARRFTGLGVPLPDLVQEGAVGLTHAVDRYDWRDGSRFAPYAAWWIKQAIMSALTEQARTIRLPHYLVAQQVRIRRAESAIQARLGRPATLEELAAETGLTPEAVEVARRAVQIRDSLDGRIPGDAADDRTPLVDVVRDPTAPDPAEVAQTDDLRAQVQRAVAALPCRERDVVVRHYGLGGKRTESLQEIAADLGLSRERVRQLEQHALASLARRLPHDGGVRRQTTAVG